MRHIPEYNILHNKIGLVRLGSFQLKFREGRGETNSLQGTIWGGVEIAEYFLLLLVGWDFVLRPLLAYCTSHR
jgi:hypothetical protein